MRVIWASRWAATYNPDSIAGIYYAKKSVLLTTLTPRPDQPYSTNGDQALYESIAQYVVTAVQYDWDHSIPIRYVVGLYGLPFSDSRKHLGDGTGPADHPSVPAMINAMSTAGGLAGAYAAGQAADRFTVAEYGGPLVAWLDMGSYDATIAYIDKEKAAACAGGLLADGVTISGAAAGVGGSNVCPRRYVPRRVCRRRVPLLR